MKCKFCGSTNITNLFFQIPVCQSCNKIQDDEEIEEQKPRYTEEQLNKIVKLIKES